MITLPPTAPRRRRSHHDQDHDHRHRPSSFSPGVGFGAKQKASSSSSSRVFLRVCFCVLVFASMLTRTTTSALKNDEPGGEEAKTSSSSSSSSSSLLEKTFVELVSAESPEWLTSVEAFLREEEEDEDEETTTLSSLTPSLSKQHTKPYGNPNTGACLPNEMKVQIQGIAGSFCSPKCGSNLPCPMDSYKGATAKGQCVLQVPSSPTPSQCALICRPEPGTNGGCPRHGECQPIQGLGICTYPSSSLSSSSSSSSSLEGEEEETVMAEKKEEVTLKVASA